MPSVTSSNMTFSKGLTNNKLMRVIQVKKTGQLKIQLLN